MTLRRGLALPAVVLLLLAGCTSDDDKGRPAASPDASSSPRPPHGSVVVGVYGEPATLDPYSPSASELTWQLVRPVYPSLFRMKPDGTVEEDLASEMVRTDGGVRIELADRKWSNGAAIKAADVVASIKSARPPSGFALIDKARAVGPRIVKLEGDVEDWRSALATVAFVLPRKGRAYGGPFVISKRIPGLEISYERNKRWPGSTGLEGFTVQSVVGTDTLIELLERKRLDVATIPSSVNLGERLDENGIDHASTLGWELVYLDLDGSDPSLQSGLLNALDRAALVEDFVRSEGRIANTMHPGPGPRGAAGPFSKAAPADGTLPSTMQVSAPTGDELLEFMQRVIQLQLEDAGVTAELVNAEPDRIYGEWSDTDPFDIAVKRAGGAPGDRSERSEVGAIPVANVDSVAAWTAPVVGIAPNPTYDGLLWNVQDWFLPEG